MAFLSFTVGYPFNPPWCGEIFFNAERFIFYGSGGLIAKRACGFRHAEVLYEKSLAITLNRDVYSVNPATSPCFINSP